MQSPVTTEGFPVYQVFIDANIYISSGDISKNAEFLFLQKLVQYGTVSILSTDLTEYEAVKHKVQFQLKLLKPLLEKKCRGAFHRLTASELPKFEEYELKVKLEESEGKRFKADIAGLNVCMIDCAAVPSAAILEAYKKDSGFFSAEAKREQFPDAYMFEAVKQRATEETPVVIVSKDNDFDNSYVRDAPNISLVKSLKDCFGQIGLSQGRIDNLINFVKGKDKEITTQITKLLIGEYLFDYRLGMGDFDSSFEIGGITDIQLLLADEAEISIFKDEDSALLQCLIKVDADVNYSYVSEEDCMWDSEDKVYLQMDETSGTEDIELEIEVSISIIMDEDGKPEDIDEVSLRGDKWREINLFSEEY